MTKTLRANTSAVVVAISVALSGCMSVMESVPMDKIADAEYLKLSARLGATAASAPGCLRNYEASGEAGVLAWSCAYALEDLSDRYELNGDKASAESFVQIADRIVADYNTTVVDAYRGRVVGGWVSTRYSGGKPHVWAVHTGLIAASLARFANLVKKRADAAYMEKARTYTATAVAAYREMEPDWADGSYRNYQTGGNRVKGSPLPANMMAAMGRLADRLDLAGASGNYAARIGQIWKRIDESMKPSMSGGKQVLVWNYDYVSGPEDISHAILTMSFITRAYERRLVPQDRFQLILASFLHEGVGRESATAGHVDGAGDGINFDNTCRRALPIYRHSAPTFRRCEAVKR